VAWYRVDIVLLQIFDNDHSLYLVRLICCWWFLGAFANASTPPEVDMVRTSRVTSWIKDEKGRRVKSGEVVVVVVVVVVCGWMVDSGRLDGG